jgi:hypothetical protein
MVVGSTFMKKRNFCFFRVTYGRQVKFHDKMELRFFRAKSWPSGQISRKKRNFGYFRLTDGVGSFHEKKEFWFFRAKSWSSGQISRINIISVSFRVNHGCRVKFHEKT